MTERGAGKLCIVTAAATAVLSKAVLIVEYLCIQKREVHSQYKLPSALAQRMHMLRIVRMHYSFLCWVPNHDQYLTSDLAI